MAPKQKQRVQPFGLATSRENVPRRHWSHRGPCTFSWGQEGTTGQGGQPCARVGCHPTTGLTVPKAPTTSQRDESPLRRQDEGRGGVVSAGLAPDRPHLARALACEGVACSRCRACFVAVAGAAAGEAVEPGSTSVTAASGHVGSAPAVRVQQPLGLSSTWPLALTRETRGAPHQGGAPLSAGDTTRGWMGSGLSGRRPGTAPRPRGPAPWCSLALATVHITGGVHEFLDAGPRAVTLLTADQGVAAKGLGLADDTVGWDGARRADALACELITEAAAAVTGCGARAQAPVRGPDGRPGDTERRGRRGHPTPSLVPPSSGPQAPGSSSDVASAGQSCCLVPGTSWTALEGLGPRRQDVAGPVHQEHAPDHCFLEAPLDVPADWGTHACSWGSPSSQWHSGSSHGL